MRFTFAASLLAALLTVCSAFGQAVSSSGVISSNQLAIFTDNKHIKGANIGTGLAYDGTSVSATGTNASVIGVKGTQIANPNFTNNTEIDFANSSSNITATIQNGAITDVKVNATGITTRSKLPGPIAYEDEANTFSLSNIFSGGLSGTVLNGTTAVALNGTNLYGIEAGSNITTTTNGGRVIINSSGGSSFYVGSTNVTNPSLSGTTPVAPANGKLIGWQTSGTNISGALVGNGNSGQYLDGTGNYSTPAGGSATAFNGVIPSSPGNVTNTGTIIWGVSGTNALGSATNLTDNIILAFNYNTAHTNIDWSTTAKGIYSYTTNANMTMTFSGSPADGYRREYVLTNSAASNIVVTLPSNVKEIATVSVGNTTSSKTILANSIARLQFLYLGGYYYLSGPEYDNPLVSAIANLSGTSSAGLLSVYGGTNASVVSTNTTSGLAVVTTNVAPFFTLTSVGAGTVTSVAADQGADTWSGSAITSSGTVRTTRKVNFQIGTSYTITTNDWGKSLIFTNASAITVTLPQAGASFPNGFYFNVETEGPGVVTINASGSVISGSSSLALPQMTSAMISCDGTNYYANKGNVLPLTLLKTEMLSIVQFWTNNLAQPATYAFYTNVGDSYYFLDAQTNTLWARWDSPTNWNGDAIQLEMETGTISTNNTSNTNVVWATAAAALAKAGQVDAPTWGTETTTTNHVHKSPYFTSHFNTTAMTPGGSITPGQTVLIRLVRATGDGTDNNTNQIHFVGCHLNYLAKQTILPSALPAVGN